MGCQDEYYNLWHKNYTPNSHKVESTHFQQGKLAHKQAANLRTCKWLQTLHIYYREQEVKLIDILEFLWLVEAEGTTFIQNS